MHDVRKQSSLLRVAPRAACWGIAILLASAGCQIVPPPGQGSCNDPAWMVENAQLKRSIPTADARTAPLFILRFDRQGECCTPDLAASVIARWRSGRFTDLYVLCPGWNRNAASATGWAESFAAGNEQALGWLKSVPSQAASPAESTPASDSPPAESPSDAAGARPQPTTQPATQPASQPLYRPAYVLLLWPGDVLVDTFPSPSPSAQPQPARPDADRDALAEVLGTDVEPRQVDRILQALRDRGHLERAIKLENLLTRASTLLPPEQLDLADCLLPLFGPQAEPSAPGPRFAVREGRMPVRRIPPLERSGLLEVRPAPVPSMPAGELLAVWKASARRSAVEVAPRPSVSAGEDDSKSRRKGLSVAELVRWALRAADLHLMKDRAFVVGQNGCGAFLTSIRQGGGPSRVHLVGHSFGCEVLMSALDASGKTNPVDSLLMLEPVVSSYAAAVAPQIASDVAPTLQRYATPGSFQYALQEGVKRSVAVVYSSRDWITQTYAPAALRRPPLEGLADNDDWAGEGKGFQQMGAAGLTGMESQPAQESLIAPAATPRRYDFVRDGSKFVNIDASEQVMGHGDANGRNIWWLLANQTAAP